MAKKMNERHVSVLALGLAVMLGSSGVAWAQAPVVYGDGPGSVGPVTPDTPAVPASGADATTITDPQQVAACLCAQSAMTNASAGMQTERQKYEAARNRLQSLNDQVASKRGQIDSAQPDQVQAYRDLIGESEKANAFVYNRATPDYDDAVHKYNDSVAIYNTTCAGRGIQPEMKAKVEVNLYCPAAPAAVTITTKTVITTPNN